MATNGHDIRAINFNHILLLILLHVTDSPFVASHIGARLYFPIPHRPIDIFNLVRFLYSVTQKRARPNAHTKTRLLH